MNSDFLNHLHAQANALSLLTHQALHPAVGHTADLAAVDAQAAKVLAMIDAEIKRPLNAQELEAQHADTRPLPGETPKQTADRLKAQDFDNRLVARP